uniref:Transposon protein, putative, unclassified n=1 Tax=Oryza sativa subsp. japonica TaxID=39947 RepID=Q2QZN0_ORYSJ|nr:transposon protein, putative, unclassified [Oryza sativa Japonica Group]
MELEGHGRGHKRRRLSGQATTQLVEEVDKQQEEEAPAPTCSICLQPWTCNGDHRICCIPCGHVYGRSCLEKWLLHAVLQRGTGQAKLVTILSSVLNAVKVRATAHFLANAQKNCSSIY